jgi:hypothetical protein
MRAFSRDTTALNVLDSLFENEATVYSSLYFETGSQQGLHRDTPFYWTKPGYSYFGMWVAFEDIDESNGPLVVVRGGNHLPEPNLVEIRRSIYKDGEPINPVCQKLWSSYQLHIEQICAASGGAPETIPVSKGDVIIWHPLLPHGGARILDRKRTRHSMVMHVSPYNVPVFVEDVFFDPAAHDAARTESGWLYNTFENRRYVSQTFASVAHEVDVTVDDWHDLLSRRVADLTETANTLSDLRDSMTWKLAEPLWRLETHGKRKAQRRKRSTS